MRIVKLKFVYYELIAMCTNLQDKNYQKYTKEKDMDPKDNIFNKHEKDLANAIRGVNLADKITKPIQTIQTLSDRFQMQQWYDEKWTPPYTNLMKQLNLSNNLANSVTNYMDSINRLRQSLSDIIPLNVIETLNGYETLRSSIERSFVSFDPEKRYKISKKVWDDLDDCFEDLSNSETEDDIEACEKKMEECIKDLTQMLKIKDSHVAQLTKELLNVQKGVTKSSILKDILVSTTSSVIAEFIIFCIAFIFGVIFPSSDAPNNTDNYCTDSAQIISEEMTQTPEPTLDPTSTVEPTPTSENNN